MANKSSYIQLTEKSKQHTITLEEVKKLLDAYVSALDLTGKQLDWNYTQAAFPYKIRVEKWNEGESYLLLEGQHTHYYHSLLLGIGNDPESGYSKIQIALSPHSTFGDKSKANEFSQFLAKKLKGELRLFSNRVIPYQTMKL